MPGVLHQGILALIRDDPWLPFDLHGRPRPVSGTPIDRRSDYDHPTDDPERAKMRYADLVLVARDPDDPDRGIVMDVEAQRRRHKGKRWRISGYLGALEDEHQLPSVLVYVSFSRTCSKEARNWASGPGLCFDMLLLDIDTVPIPRSLEAARARPTAAVLAAALHGCRGDLDTARMGIAACRDLPEQQRQRYIAIILAAVPKRLRETLIAESTVEQRNELWDIERRSGTYLLGLENGREEGREEGREQGQRMALAEVILETLESRGMSVDPDMEARIRGCESISTLRQWARRSREVTRAADMFKPNPPARRKVNRSP